MNMKKVREIAYKVGKIFIFSIGMALVTTTGVIVIVAPLVALAYFFQSDWAVVGALLWVFFSIAFLYQLIV